MSRLSWNGLISGQPGPKALPTRTPAFHTQNTCLGAVLYLTSHARQRWEERFGGGDIEQHLRDAVEVSGSYGKNSKWLMSGDVVFMARRSRNKWVVATVLTRMQAQATLATRLAAALSRKDDA